MVAVIAGILALAGSQMGGCGPGGNDDAIPSVSMVVVVSVTDSYTASLQGVRHSETVTRPWPCTAAQANLALGQSIAEGSVRIQVFDDAGTSVYDNTHGASVNGLSTQTRPGGAPGTWTVILTVSDATWQGAITLNADSPPSADGVTLGSGFSTSGSWTFHAGWSAGTAQVTVAAGLSSGSVRIRIWDGAAALVYDRTLTPVTGAVSEPTASGAAGTWTIVLDFGGAVAGGAVSLAD